MKAVSLILLSIILVSSGQIFITGGMPQRFSASEDSGLKNVADTADVAEKASLRGSLDYDGVNRIFDSSIVEKSGLSFNISPLSEGKSEKVKKALFEADEWSPSSEVREREYFFKNSFGPWKNGIKPGVETSYDEGYFCSDDDSIELVVGLDWQIDVKSILLHLTSEDEANIINEVSAGDETLAFIVDVPYQTLQSFASALKTLNFVRYIEPNMRFEICYTPDDPDWPLQWGPKKIDADDAWDIQMGSSDVLVAVIDTGIDWNHPDLEANYVPLGYDWVNGDSDPMDDHGHGTHCSGVIAAVVNNTIGIAGLAQVRIMAEKGLDAAGYGWSDDLANCIIHAVDQGAKILSNSWGSYSASSLIQDAVQYAQDHEVLVLAAAGNSATSEKHYPAAFDEVVAVTATDNSDLPAWFTNFGDWVDVAAPGVSVYSTIWDDSYGYMSGTSMAAPHAAGVAALIWSQYPEMTLNEVRNHLKFTADDLGSPGFDEYYGYGRINALKAVHPPPTHDLLILSQKTPFLVELGSEARINTTVFNYGTSNETNVVVQLLANGSLVDSYTIPQISTGASETVHLSWTPPVDAIYNITSYIVPVPYENNTANNAASALMRACIPVNVLWDDVHDGDGDSLLGNYFSLYKTLSLQGYAVTELTSGSFNSTVLSDYSILVLIDPEINFSPSEIDDIQSWVDSGGKLLVIPDAGWPSTLNSLLAPYGIQVTLGRSGGGVTNDIAYHPITENVESIYYSAAYDLDFDPPYAMELAWTTESYALLSISNRVVVLSDSNIMDNYGLGKSDNEKLMVNIFNLIGVRCEHDLSVSLDAPALLSPGESSQLNASVYNLGLRNETDVELALYIDGSMVKSTLIPNMVNGSSYTFSYVWTPLDEGIYNLTVYSPPVAGENVTVNNAYSFVVRSVVVPEMYVALFKNVDPWGDATNEEVLSFYGIPYEVYSSNDFGSVDLDTFDKVIIASDQDQSFYDEINDYAWWFEDYVARGGLLEIHAADEGWHGGHWTGPLPGGLGWTYSASDYVSIVNVTHPVVTRPFLITDDELDGWRSSVHGYFDTFPEWSRIVINVDSTSLPAYLEFSYGKGTIVASSQTLEWAYSHRYSNILENSILYKPEVRSFTHELHVSLKSLNLLLGESSQIVATVYNLGLYNETGVELFLLVNGMEISSLTIPQLDNGTSQSISYLWTPTATGWYNVTAYAPPVPGEDFAVNNIATKLTAVANVLVYTDDAYTTSSQRYPIVALDNLGIPYVHYADDYSGFGTALTSYPWGLVIVSHNNWYAVGNYWNELEAYVLEGGRLILSTFDVDGSHSESTTLWSTLGAEWVSDISSPEPVYRWAPTHLIFTIPNEVGDFTSYSEGYLDDGDRIRATTGTAIAGFTTTPTENCAAIVVGNSARTLLMSFILSEFRGDEDADRKLDAVELWENAIAYISAPLEHNLLVTLQAPAYLKPRDSALLNATVYNIGLNNETDVFLSLLVNGTVVNSASIPKLVNGTHYTLSYLWSPTLEGLCNVTAYAPPVLGEDATTNNLASKMVYVGEKVALISYYSVLTEVTDILDSMGVIYDIYNYNYANLYTENLSLLLDYGTVIYSNCYGLTSNEYTTLQSYLSSGGNLLVTGVNSLIWDPLLAELVCSSSYGDNMDEPDLYVTDASHPIMDGPYGSFPEGYHVSGLYNDCDAAEADTSRGAVTVAELADGYDKIIATYIAPGKVVYWNGKGPGDWTDNADCEAMLKNTLRWFETRYEHDLAVSLEMPMYLLPGDSCLLNVTVSNYGLEDESDVAVQLLVNGTAVLSEVIPVLVCGTSTTLSHSWTPVLGQYNVTAYVQPVSDENYTGNNRASEWVDVSTSPRHFGDIVVAFEEVLIIEDVYFTQTGNIFVRDHAALVVRNATLDLNQTNWCQYQISVSGSAVLRIEDGFIVSNAFFYTRLEGSAEGWLNSTYFGYDWSIPPTSPIGYIYAEDDAVLTASNSTFYGLICYGDSVVSVYDSTINYLYCSGYAVVSVAESNITWQLYVSNWDSTNVSLTASTVGYLSIGFASSSRASLTGLNPGHIGFWSIHVNGTVSGVNWNLTLVDTEVTQGWDLSCYSDSEVSVSDSTLGYLICFGDSVLSVYDSTINYLYCYYGSVVSISKTTVYGLGCYYFTGLLFFDETLVDGWWYIYYSQFYIGGRINLTDIDLYFMDSNVTRNYTVEVTSVMGHPISDVSLALYDEDDVLVWSSVTDELGAASFNVTYTDGNYASTLSLEAMKGGASTTGDLTLTSCTPLKILLSPCVHLESQEDTGATTNLGTITFDGTSYGLPDDVPKAAGSYSAEYFADASYVFDHWETTGGVSVSVATDNPVSVTLSGDGTLKAVYIEVAEWDVVLTATKEGYSDLSEFGVRSNATGGFDQAHDELDPPAPPIGVVSYFWYPDNPSSPVDLRKLSTSKIPPSQLMTWTYKVKPVGIDGTMKISWNASEIATIPSEYGVYLLDSAGYVVADMRVVTEHSFAAELDTMYTFTIRVVYGCDFELHLSAGWNMVSFPCLPRDDHSFSNILGDIGFYQVLTWNGTSYIAPTTAEAGRGYWILVLEDTTVNVTSGDPVERFEFDLPAGWSMIGSIITYTVDADRVFPGWYQLLTWDGTSYVSTTAIDPGKGYWVCILEETHIVVDESCRMLGQKVSAPQNTAKTASNSWDVQLTASLSGYSDVSICGVKENATEGFDIDYDQLDPPAPPTGVVSYFYYPNNPSSPVDLRKLSSSFIPPADVLTWDYMVYAVGIDGTMTISWDTSQVEAIPSQYVVQLLNSSDGTALVDMRSASSYSFAVNSETMYSFTIKVWNVPDFGMSADPASLTFTKPFFMKLQKVTINVTSMFNFSSPVDLSATWIGTKPEGIIYFFSETSVIPPSGGNVTTTLVVIAFFTVPPGSYALRVTGTSGEQTHYVNITINIS